MFLVCTIFDMIHNQYGSPLLLTVSQTPAAISTCIMKMLFINVSLVTPKGGDFVPNGTGFYYSSLKSRKMRRCIYICRDSLWSYIASMSTKAWRNRTTLLVNMSIIMLVECSWIFHVLHRSGQIGQHSSPTNSIRHKLNAVYVVLVAV